MKNQSSTHYVYGKPIEMPLPLRGNNPIIESVYDPHESRKTQYYAGSLITFIEESAYDRIRQHTNSDTRHEVGGALLGKYCVDSESHQQFILVTEAFPAKPEINENLVSPSSVRFTHTFFRKLDEHLDIINQKDPHIIRLGMYHSHPGYSVFMSPRDVATFRDTFFEPWHICLIIDPVNRDAGVFYWEDWGKEERRISDKTGFTFFRFKRLEHPLIEDKKQDLDAKGSENAHDETCTHPDTSDDSQTHEDTKP